MVSAPYERKNVTVRALKPISRTILPTNGRFSRAWSHILVCKPWLAHKPFYLVFPFCWCQGLDVMFASSSLHFYVHVPIETCVASTSIYNHIHVITPPIVTLTHSIHSSNLIAMMFIVISTIRFSPFNK